MQYNNQKKSAQNLIISEIKIILFFLFFAIITSNQKCQKSLLMNYVIHFLHLVYFYFDAVKTLTLQYHTSMTDIAGC